MVQRKEGHSVGVETPCDPAIYRLRKDRTRGLFCGQRVENVRCDIGLGNVDLVESADGTIVGGLKGKELGDILVLEVFCRQDGIEVNLDIIQGASGHIRGVCIIPIAKSPARRRRLPGSSSWNVAFKIGGGRKWIDVSNGHLHDSEATAMLPFSV